MSAPLVRVVGSPTQRSVLVLASLVASYVRSYCTVLYGMGWDGMGVLVSMLVTMGGVAILTIVGVV